MKRLIFYWKLFVNKRCLLMAMAVLLPVLLFAQRYSLDEVLNRTEKNNPSLQSYQNRANAADENAKGARAWMPPVTGVMWDMVPYNDYSKGLLRFSVSQDFPNPQKNYAKEGYMKSMAATERYSGEFHRVELFTEAKESYYRLYVSKRRVGILKESSEALKLMIELAQKQMAITKGDLASVYRLKARLTENETMIVHEENAIRSLIATLSYLMYEDVNQTFEIDTTGLLKNYRGLSTHLTVDSLDWKRSDIMKVNSEINTMKLSRQYTSLRRKPEFGVRVEHDQLFTGMPSLFTVGGTMTIPSAPWSAKGYEYEVRSMDYQIAALENNKKEITNRAMQMIKMYLIELESEYKELDNYSLSVIPAYRKSLDANLLAYGQNTNDMNMTLLAWDDFLMAQMEYLKHLDTYFRIQAEYEKELQIR